MRKFKRGAKKFKKTRPTKYDRDFEIVRPLTTEQMFDNVKSWMLKNGWDWTAPKSFISVKEFYNKLESRRKPSSDDPYDNRITHCRILYNIEGTDHEFVVRGWSYKNDELNISTVNWTIAAGTCTLTVTEDNLLNLKIVD